MKRNEIIAHIKKSSSKVTLTPIAEAMLKAASK